MPGLASAPTVRLCVPVSLPAGPDGLAVLLPALRAALTGTGPAIAPLPADSPSGLRGRLMAAQAPGEPVPASVAAVLATSGSTGTPRGVLLPAAAIAAGATALTQATGRPSGYRWVAALPLHSAGGFMLVARAVLAGVLPVATRSLGGAFSVDDLAAATDAAETLSSADAMPLAVSVVPTMLARIVAAGGEGMDTLARYHLVLVGGAASEPRMLARLRTEGIAVRTSYGMTETCGGVVLDGVPLPGVRVTSDAEGRLRIAGAQVALGYRSGDPAGDWRVAPDGLREFRTNDLGHVVDGVVAVTGRVDDVVQVGGASVSLDAVRAVLMADAEVADAQVVALPDARWGAEVVALVVTDQLTAGGGSARGRVRWCASGDVAVAVMRADLADRLRESVVAALGRPAQPRRLLEVDAIPLLPAGKPDVAALRRLANPLGRMTP